ncbi:hypothetical protein COCON_G00091450, partial [Conger conger]
MPHSLKHSFVLYSIIKNIYLYIHYQLHLFWIVVMDTGLIFFLIVFVYSFECRAEDTVTQSTGGVIAFEGESVTLGCNFSTSSVQTYLFWYIQYPNGFPKYMLRRDVYGSKDTAQEFDERFDADLN